MYHWVPTSRVSPNLSACTPLSVHCCSSRLDLARMNGSWRGLRPCGAQLSRCLAIFRRSRCLDINHNCRDGHAAVLNVSASLAS